MDCKSIYNTQIDAIESTVKDYIHDVLHDEDFI